MVLKERLRELRGNTSAAEFCRQFDIHRNTLPRYEKGDRVPGADLLAEICKKYDIHADWLLLGIGPKNINESPKPEIDQDILIDAIAGLEEVLIKKGRKMSPGKKAEIISEIYKMFVEDKITEKNKESITKLLQLVV